MQKAGRTIALLFIFLLFYFSARLMVGLSYPGDNLNYTTLRTKDLTPTKDPEFARDSGGGAAFLSFIKESVIPNVEREYRVDKNQRAIAGWSFGGLFALTAMYKEPQLFNRCVAISPAVPWHKGIINQMYDDFFKSNQKFSGRVFISYGKNENPNFVSAVIEFQKKVDDKKNDNVKLMNVSVENMGHAGAKASGYAQGLSWVWQDLEPN